VKGKNKKVATVYSDRGCKKNEGKSGKAQGYYKRNRRKSKKGNMVI